MRSPTAAFATALAKPHLDDVVFAELQFASGSSFVCSREHDVAWNGQDWLGRGRVGSIEMVGEGHELEARGIAMSLSGLPGGMLATALNPAEYKNRPAKLWYGLLEPDMIDFDFTQGTLAAQVGAALASITFTRAGATATRVNEEGLIEVVAADTPRFDYDPVTLALKGLLTEGATTNWVAWTDYIAGGAYYSFSNTTLSDSGIASPVAGKNWTKFEATTTAISNAPKTLIGVGKASGLTYSVYVKKGSGALDANKYWLHNSTTGATILGGSLNFDTGVFTILGGAGVARVVDLGDGEYRVALTATTNMSDGDNVAFYTAFTGDSETAGEYSYAVAPQVEHGRAATSLILTEGASSTRNADQPDIADISGLINATEGTFVVEASFPVIEFDSTGRWVFQADDGTENEAFRMLVDNPSPGNGQFRITDGAVAQVAIAAKPGGYVANVPSVMAMAYKLNDCAASADGAAAVADNTATMPVVDRIRFGRSVAGTGYMNGHLRRFTYFPKRLGNAALVRLSAGGDPAAEAVGRRVVADPVGPFLYRMDSLEFELGEQASVRLTAESRLADWDRPRVRRYNDADQQNEYPGDKFFEYAERMVEWQETW